MENKAHALIAGLFIIVMLALLFGLGAWLTRDQGRAISYELTTPGTVSGLQPQATVRYKGVPVGKVTYIGFDPQARSNVLIRIDVDEDAPISSHTFASLNFQGITGLTYVLLEDAPEPLPPQPQGKSGLPRLPLHNSSLEQIAENIPDILIQVRDSLGSLNALLADENRAAMMQTVNKFGHAADSVAQASERLEPALNELPQLIAQARRTLNTIEGSASNFNQMTAEARAVLADIRKDGGTLDQLQGGSRAMSQAADAFAVTTLPALNLMAGEIAQLAVQLRQQLLALGANPQVLLYGPGERAPGPGEAGFTAPAPASGQ